MKLRMLVTGPVTTLTGYGQDVCGLVQALLELGVDVDLWPMSVDPPVPEPVAALLTRTLTPGKYDVVLWYASPDRVTPWELAGWGERVIGFTMWERTPLLPSDLPWWDDDDPDLAAGRVWSWRPGRWAADGPKAWLDALVVTCPMNVDAFSELDPHVPIRVLTPGLTLKDWPAQSRDREPGAPVVFGCEGVLSGRKDPGALFAAWDQFSAMYPGLPKRLELHVQGNPRECIARAQARPDGDVVVHTGSWDQARELEWYASLDCWVSTSRGEGVNKPALQALATGMPVIAAPWGGHETWCHPAHAYPVPFELVVTDDGLAQECRPDVAAVAEAMGEAATDTAERRRRGANAARFVAASLGWERQAMELLRIAGQA